jgi:hypothetical protein
MSKVEVRLRWGVSNRGLKALRKEISVDGRVRLRGYTEYRKDVPTVMDLESLIAEGLSESGVEGHPFTVNPSLEEIAAQGRLDQ